VSINDLLNRIIDDIFNERDAVKRSAAIAEIFSEDIIFVDPEGETRGRAALEEKVSALLKGQPEAFRFGDVHVSQTAGDLGIHHWKLGPAGGDPVATGVDVALVDGDRITRLWTLLD
jgi:hypothetical protein